ncbi:c-type cytochrome biogenesis protein CcmI [Aliidiomarina soli]|uniref:C-type cytochrome biogenesis protein CcmI n=1 Tax=Aliidiomarina soli TaxID=1928574 RepID=A0A432WCY8_9GAMM|nr:c-type cytochrome biogenesis protein CcmI [Aliidiomarina soli]RUO30269.1 c-type cytochrome biogenesis protein CcmI [Aliidiomarina soli]
MMWYAVLAALLVVAVLILVWVRRQQSAAYSIQASNRTLYEARRRELEGERNEGTLSESDYDHALLELQKSFIAENDDDEKPVREEAANMWLPAGLLVALVLVLYFVVGDSWKLQRQADDAMLALPELSERILGNGSEQPSMEEVETFALGLRQRLDQQPDAGAWLLYGRVMMQMREIEQAIEAYERSLRLDPNRTATLITHAQALIMMGSDNDLARAAGNIRQVLDADAMNAEALGLLGVVAFERGDYAQAKQAWEITLQLLDSNDPRYAAIETSLAQVETRLSGDLVYLTVTVDISETLRNEMPPQANLFVFVRDPDGSRAPAAVIRQPVSDFPVTLTLTENDAMVDGHTLATIESWLVSARLTTAETIEIGPGVMEARPRLLETESGQQVNLTITEMH